MTVKQSNGFDVGNVISLEAQAFADLGLHEVAYVREISADQAGEMFSQSPGINSEITLYAAFAADGAPLFLSGSLPALVGEALAHDLQLVPLH